MHAAAQGGITAGTLVTAEIGTYRYLGPMAGLNELISRHAWVRIVRNMSNHVLPDFAKEIIM